jgi:hypothetical protein
MSPPCKVGISRMRNLFHAMVQFLPLTFSKVRGRLDDIVKMNTRDYPIYRHPEIVLLLLFFEAIDLVIFIKMSIKYWPSLIFGHNK